MPALHRLVLSFVLPLLAVAGLATAAGCDDKPAESRERAAEPKSNAGQQMDKAKAEIDATQQALEERGDHIADQSNAQ